MEPSPWFGELRASVAVNLFLLSFSRLTLTHCSLWCRFLCSACESLPLLFLVAEPFHCTLELSHSTEHTYIRVMLLTPEQSYDTGVAIPEKLGLKDYKIGKLISRRNFKWLNVNLDYSVTYFTLGLRWRYSNWTTSTKHILPHGMPCETSSTLRYAIINMPLRTEKVLSIKLCHLNYVDCYP